MGTFGIVSRRSGLFCRDIDVLGTALLGTAGTVITVLPVVLLVVALSEVVGLTLCPGAALLLRIMTWLLGD